MKSRQINSFRKVSDNDWALAASIRILIVPKRRHAQAGSAPDARYVASFAVMPDQIFIGYG